MSKELCDCGKTAVWCYLPGFSSGDNPHFCDDCVSRGCSCNWNSTLEEYENKPEGIKDVDYKWIDSTTWTHIDEKGREYPCVEYMYDEEGWDIE